VADSSTAELGAPLVARWVEDRAVDILAANLTLMRNDVHDDVLEARYLTDPEYELTVRHILFFSERWRTRAERDEARAKAERALALLREGAHFAETASRLSEEPGAEGRQGLLTPGRRGAWVDEFWAAASALDVGDISDVTETQYGFHILRLEGREVVPFEEARPRVAREVARRVGDPEAVLAARVDEKANKLVYDEDALARAPDVEPDAVLAHWPEWQLTFGDYVGWETTQPASWNRGGMGVDPARFDASVMALARRQIALVDVEAMRVEVPPEERAALARQWDDTTNRWATDLGFRYGTSPEAVGEAALAALADPAQSAAIARDEIDARAPLIEARYEITVGSPAS
jgi:hypothetical protein